MTARCDVFLVVFNPCSGNCVFFFAGAAYLDLPATLLTQNVDKSKIITVSPCPPPPLTYPSQDLIERATFLLMRAKKPLVIIGKGMRVRNFIRKKHFSRLSNYLFCFDYFSFSYFFFVCDFYIGAAYGLAEEPAQKLIYSTDLPFLPTPMGKGVVPDVDERCVSSARTYALLNADVILLLGARLNWMLHFGRPPRFQKDVKVIQVSWKRFFVFFFFYSTASFRSSKCALFFQILKL